MTRSLVRDSDEAKKRATALEDSPRGPSTMRELCGNYGHQPSFMSYSNVTERP